MRFPILVLLLGALAILYLDLSAPPKPREFLTPAPPASNPLWPRPDPIYGNLEDWQEYTFWLEARLERCK